MKIVWEPEDIKPGRRYSRKGLNETWLIGYDARADNEERFRSISLSDGLVTPASTAEDLAKQLTEDKYVPVEFLPAAS